MPRRNAAKRRAIAAGIGILFALLITALASTVCSDGGVEGGPLGLTPDDTANLLSGGETTAVNVTRNAFSFSARNLTREQRRRFELGDSFFEQNWVTAPASTEARDGLGPTFNAQSCSSCHALDGRGRPPFSNDDPEPACCSGCRCPRSSATCSPRAVWPRQGAGRYRILSMAVSSRTGRFTGSSPRDAW